MPQEMIVGRVVFAPAALDTFSAQAHADLARLIVVEAERDALHKEVEALKKDAMMTSEKEREACLQLCRRPAGWLSESQQRVVDEIRAAIKARSNLRGQDEIL